jgi:hypothetical protein
VAARAHNDPGRLLRLLAWERIHREENLELCSVDQQLVANWVAKLERRMTFDTCRSARVTRGRRRVSSPV